MKATKARAYMGILLSMSVLFAAACSSQQATRKPRPKFAKDASYRRSPPAIVRMAYVVTVGVGANQSGWNLNFTSKSAHDIDALLETKLDIRYGGEFNVVRILLLSTLTADGGIQLSQASKHNIQTVLDLLAGRMVKSQNRKAVPSGSLIKPATPDDVVVLFISSHGYADPRGNFYVLPYDTGQQEGISERLLNRWLQPSSTTRQKDEARAFLKRCISSDELAQWWYGVDAGEMVMILDSCHAGAVPGRDFRPGPLGDPGFGQLAYDKGLRILCASQPDKTAAGTDLLDRSLLADVLVQTADAPSHKSRTLKTWLAETERLLPRRYKDLYPNSTDENIQAPMLLDFTRENGEVTFASRAVIR